MSAQQIAADHARARARLAERMRLEAEAAWRRVDERAISATWAAQLPRLLLQLTFAQREAAATAEPYVARVLAAQGAATPAAGLPIADALAGVASDGRELVTLLSLPGITALSAIGDGASVARAMAGGGALAQLIAHTQVADAGRVADGVALAARPQSTGFVRMVVGKTCSRCIVLAGRWYRWNAGFNRHPKCDCIGIPAAENAKDMRTDPQETFRSMTAAEQDKAFGKAGAQAIRDGADMNSVVNARRGMQKAADGRLYTTEAAGKRPRLMPEQIYAEARGDRAEAVRLLRLHGFIR